MKLKLVSLLAIFVVFGLAIAVYAYQQTSSATSAKASCCKDTCPMKKSGDHNSHAKKEGHDCCGDSCPMKSGAKSAEGAADCCCRDSCPMMEKRSAEGTVAAATEASTESCCECCKAKKPDAAP